MSMTSLTFCILGLLNWAAEQFRYLLCDQNPRLFIDLKLSGGCALRKQWVTAELLMSSYLIEGRAQQDACLEPKVRAGTGPHGCSRSFSVADVKICRVFY